MAVEVLGRIKANHPEVTAWAASCKFGGHGDRHVLIAHCRAARRYLEAAYPTEIWGILAVSKTSGHAADQEMWEGTGVRDGGWITGYVCVPNPAWHDIVAAVRAVADVVFDVQYVVGTYVQDERFLATLHEGSQRMAPFASYYSRFPLSNNELALRFPTDQWALMSRSCPVTVTPADMHAPCELPAITLKAPPGQSRARDFVQRMGGCCVIHAGQGGSHGRKLPHPDVWRAVAAACWEQGAIPVQVGIPSEPSVLGAVDARGLSIAETGYLVNHARLVVAAEGFMAYVARAVDTRALVWFGPTSATLFAFGREVDLDGKVIFPGHINWSANRCEVCWWHTDGWDKKPCPRGHPYCVNLPSASDAEAATAWALQGLAAEAVPASEQSVVESCGGTTEPAEPAERKENGAMGEQERSGDLLTEREWQAKYAATMDGGLAPLRALAAEADRERAELGPSPSITRRYLCEVHAGETAHFEPWTCRRALAEQERKLDALAKGAEVATETFGAGVEPVPAKPAEPAKPCGLQAVQSIVGAYADTQREPWEAPDDGAQVHLVMTTYERRGFLKRTLDSLGGKTLRPATLWLMDDASSEPASSELVQFWHWLQTETQITIGGIIMGGARVGQAGQLNRGFALVRDAIRQSGWLNRTYMVKIEDDLEFTEGWLRRLIYTWEHPDAAGLNLGLIGGAYGQPGKHLPIGREQVKLTHHVGAWCMFAPLTMWEDYLPIPPRPRTDAQGGEPPSASSADWYITRRGRRSVLACGRQCACLGVVKHIGTAEGDSTWKR